MDRRRILQATLAATLVPSVASDGDDRADRLQHGQGGAGTDVLRHIADALRPRDAQNNEQKLIVAKAEAIQRHAQRTASRRRNAQPYRRWLRP